ncbi:hypothetical protein HAX54_045027 [Datura stramonium]|uniref:Uncharacterized protein n=1 Tax=Datura stramonium TaxID=4076 RepID=A0ABS8SQI4_DATST|nr:hypothetical protein [Datura stramonium]
MELDSAVATSNGVGFCTPEFIETVTLSLPKLEDGRNGTFLTHMVGVDHVEHWAQRIQEDHPASVGRKNSHQTEEMGRRLPLKASFLRVDEKILKRNPHWVDKSALE